MLVRSSPVLPVIAIALGMAWVGFAQEFLFREFTPIEGLSHSTVFCTFQDRTGYLWFGNYETLHKFDGHRFQEPLKSFDINANRIRNITQDQNGDIWIATHEGAIRMGPEEIQVLTELDGLIHNSVNDIFVDNSNRVWFATDGGLSRLAPNGEWRHFRLADGLPHPHVRRLIRAESDTFWVATLGGLALFDGSYLQPIELDPQFQSLSIYALSMDAKGRLWLGTTQGLFCLTAGELQRFGLADGLPANNIWALEIDRHGRLWVGSDAGLVMALIEPLLRGETRLRRVSETHYIGYTTIYSIDLDREGNLWFGTCIGLYQLTTAALQAFEFGAYDSGEMVISILETEPGTLWLGTDRGVLRMRAGVTENMTERLNLPDTFVRGIVPATGGGIWFATRNGAALRETPRPITLNRTSGLKGHHIFCLYQAEDGKLYLGTQGNGLALWHHGKIRTWGIAQGLSGARVHCIKPHPQGGLFIGTDRGLDWLRGDTLQQVQLPLTSCEVYDVATDQAGTSWVGTHLGIIRLDATESKIYTMEHGLPDNRCRQVAIDPKGGVWLGTSRGLTMFDGHRFNSFHPPPPASPFEMNHGATIVDHRGDMWFGHYRGALRLQPDLFRPQVKPFPIFLTQVSVLGVNHPMDQPLHLKYDRNQISFHFQGLHFRDPERIKYRYRLTGRDITWRETDLTQVTYRQLKPGPYQFQVQAGDATGHWSPSPATLAFAIHPPFWSQWWFRLTSILLLTAFIAWQFQQLRWRNRRLTQKAALLSAEVAREKASKLEREAEVKLLHSQMNPHFLQNAFTSAIYLVQTAPQKAEAMLLQLAQLFRRTMLAKREIWSSLGEECALIADYLAIQKVRFGERLVFTLICPDHLKVHQVPAFILQPLVENACIHGQRETLGQLFIEILCSTQGKGILMEVTNNGQPMDATMEPIFRQGHALDNINKRLDLLNQRPLQYRYVSGKHHFSVFVEPPQ